MLLVQLSDTHVSVPGSAIDTNYGTAARFEAALDHVAALTPGPDAVVITGDLVDAGGLDEYCRFADLLARLDVPAYLLPGNHDDRDNLRAAIDAEYWPSDGFLQYAVDLGPIRLVALDTLVPGRPGGLVCSERLEWLDACLARAPRQPTIVAMHHPPFATGITALDAMGLTGTDELGDVIGRHSQVERIVCGHVHRAMVRRVATTIASTCPSTTHQVALDLREPGELAILAEPPAFQIHMWKPTAGLVSHLGFVADGAMAATRLVVG